MSEQSAKEKTWRIAVVGMGGIGNNHARCYTANPHSEVVAVCDMDKKRADAAAKKFEVPAYYSIEDMLSAGLKIDACSVTTAGKENGGAHHQPTMELLAAGLPVLGEKPISNKISEAEEMVALATSKNLPYAINLNHRFTPAAIRAKQWVTDGRIGKVHIIKMTMWINNPNESSPHFHARALHPHSIDIMRYFGGDVSKVQAFFMKGEDRTIWSNMQANMQFANGAIGNLTGSYDAGKGYGLETCEVVGSKGRIVIKEACERLEFYPRTSNEVEIYEHLGGMQSFGDTFQARINAWIEDLRNGTKPNEIDGKAEDALKAQKIIEGAILSFEEESVVTL